MSTCQSNEMLKWDLVHLSKSLEKKEVSPVEVIKELLKRIKRVDVHLNSFITIMEEEALKSARKAEKEIMQNGMKSPLHGVPIGLKDIINTRGTSTTMGSEIFKNYIPDADATVVEKLKEAGAIIIGKLNLHQFAYGPTGDRSYYGAVRNPYNLFKMTGGSSSGSGASVAAFLCYGALGTDTGGSIRIPSSCCGIVGMKPTFGRVSKHGVFPLSWSLDHIGPMTRTVKDNAIMLGILSGYDDRDPYSKKSEAEDFTRMIGKSIKNKKIGVPTSFFFENVEKEVAIIVTKTIKSYQDLGAEVIHVDIPYLSDMLWAHQTILKTEAFAVHQKRLQTYPDKWEPEVRERLMTGLEPKGYDYANARYIQMNSIKIFQRILNQVDAVIAPTIPILPPDIDHRDIDIYGYKEHVRVSMTRLTGIADLNGFPSLSLPCGFSAEGLPVGVQLIGKPFDESILYQLGGALEQYLNLPKGVWDNCEQE